MIPGPRNLSTWQLLETYFGLSPVKLHFKGTASAINWIQYTAVDTVHCVAL